MRLSELDGKRVVVWGAGREGTAALAAIARSASPAAVALVADTLEGLPPHAPGGVVTATGEEAAALRLAADVVVRSPGISLYRDDVAELRATGVRLTTGTNLWMASRPEGVRVVGVTGTKGKSTTASLLWSMLEGAGVPAVLGGNVGRALLDLDVSPGDTVVAELSSYQLADLEHPLDVALVLNLYPEHQDWHGGLDAYARDKLRAVTLSEETRAVLNHADQRLWELGRGRRNVTWFDERDVIHHTEDGVFRGSGELLVAARDIPLLGDHNASNVAGALTAAEVLGVAAERAAPAVRSFTALPHRLELVHTDGRGRAWVDDSISTTPESTIAAMSVYADRPMTILLGGTDRWQSYDDVALVLASREEPVVALLLPDTGARIAGVLDPAIDARIASGLDEAVALADELTPDGGVVLLSPAAASFPVFKGFEERGDRFAQAARGLSA